MRRDDAWSAVQESIAFTVKREMRFRRITQGELAFRTGLRPRHVSALLGNRVDWWLRDMWLVSKALGVPIDALVREDAAA